MTVVFVKTNFGLGAGSASMASESIANEDRAREMLSYLMSERETLSATADLSEVVTDRLVAGLEIVTPKLTADTVATNALESASGSDILLRLAAGGRVIGVNPAGQEVMAFDGQGSANFALDLSAGGGLTVGGTAKFNGDSFFYKLVTFSEKTIFKNDVILTGHIATHGDAPQVFTEIAAGITAAPLNNPTASLASATLNGNDVSGQLAILLGEEATTGKVLSVTFNKTYVKPPKVLLTPANDRAADIAHYVESTEDGFKIIVTDPPLPGTSLILNYWVVE
jgi:hypothetical protein